MRSRSRVGAKAAAGNARGGRVWTNFSVSQALERMRVVHSRAEAGAVCGRATRTNIWAGACREMHVPCYITNCSQWDDF